MNAKKIYLFMILILLPVHTLTWAQVGFDQKTILRKDAPIEVVSDKMEAYQEKNVVIFSGNAVAKNGPPGDLL